MFNLEKFYEKRKEDNLPPGIFITSVGLAELVGKEHRNVTRDILEVHEKLSKVELDHEILPIEYFKDPMVPGRLETIEVKYTPSGDPNFGPHTKTTLSSGGQLNFEQILDNPSYVRGESNFEQHTKITQRIDGQSNFGPISVEPSNQIGGSNFEEILENPLSNGGHLNFEENSQEMQRFKLVSKRFVTMTEYRNGRKELVYGLTERGYITMLAAYSDYVTKKLLDYYFFVRFMKGADAETVLKIHGHILDEVTELLDMKNDLDELKRLGNDIEKQKSLNYEIMERERLYREKYEKERPIDTLKHFANRRAGIKFRKNQSIDFDGIFYASSLDVATLTEKQHLHVIRDIEKIIANILKVNPDEDLSCFHEAVYRTQQKKMVKCYTMDEKGFLLVLCHYYVEFSTLIADFYVDTKDTVIPCLEVLYNTPKEMLEAAYQIYIREGQLNLEIDDLYSSMSDMFWINSGMTRNEYIHNEEIKRDNILKGTRMQFLDNYKK